MNNSSNVSNASSFSSLFDFGHKDKQNFVSFDEKPGVRINLNFGLSENEGSI